MVPARGLLLQWREGGAVAVESMTGLLGSFTVVAFAEMGDKTQLIAFSLASRFRRPWTVMLGILLATILNHALASWAGAWVSTTIPEWILAWVLGLGFLAFAVWTLFPDRADEPGGGHRWGPLVSTTVIFFFAEMGDKTQLATVALGARFVSPVSVTAGTTAGMLVADGLAVFAGTRLASAIPMVTVRRVAATLFVLFGLAAIARALGYF
jgi:putative Ca2+/H+ antiporter (TMEM165/GDT1 family)